MFVAIGSVWGGIVGDLMFLVGKFFGNFQDDIVRIYVLMFVVAPGD